MKMEFYGEEIELKFAMDTYTATGDKAIMAMQVEDGEVVDYFGDVTRCCPGCQLAVNQIIADTNNSPKLIAEMEKNGLIKRTGQTVASGWCTYPIYEIQDKLYDEVIEEEEE